MPAKACGWGVGWVGERERKALERGSMCCWGAAPPYAAPPTLSHPATSHTDCGTTPRADGAGARAPQRWAFLAVALGLSFFLFPPPPHTLTSKYRLPVSSNRYCMWPSVIMTGSLKWWSRAGGVGVGGWGGGVFCCRGGRVSREASPPPPPPTSSHRHAQDQHGVRASGREPPHSFTWVQKLFAKGLHLALGPPFIGGGREGAGGQGGRGARRRGRAPRGQGGQGSAPHK